MTTTNIEETNSSRSSNNSEADTSELFENHQEMFPRPYILSGVYNSFKSETTQ